MEKRKFINLDESITQSLSVGIVAFSRDLKIIETNKIAEEILVESSSIDKALSLGNPSSDWPDWKLELISMLEVGQRRKHDSIPYSNGDKNWLLDIICVPLRDINGEGIIGGTIMLEDVTERVEMEKQLASSERLAAIGKVAGKVAHELNNPMDGILRYINLAQRVIETGEKEKANEYLENCKNGLNRMSKVIDELLEFSRGQDSSKEYNDLNRTIDDAIRTMQPHLELTNTTIEKNYDLTIGKIRCGSLFQVFCNLIKNASDAIESQGKIVIKTIKTEQDSIEIEFIDNGHGIEEKNLNSIFEPFFTTKRHGRGTGLGLSICQDIVKKHNGSIVARNNPDCGSTFQITLPLLQEKNDSMV